MDFDPSNKARLNASHLPRFQGDSLFDKVARTACEAGCLPRKELYESWEVARRVRRRLRGRRIVDLASGHGLVAILMLVLDDTSPNAVCVDERQPPSALRLLEVFERQWPRLSGRVEHRQASLETVAIEAEDLVVSAHACGVLTDRVLDLAVGARAPVAVLPCCHDLGNCDTGTLEGWMDPALAVDATRAARLRQADFEVHTQTIPKAITPKNRLLIGVPIPLDDPRHQS